MDVHASAVAAALATRNEFPHQDHPFALVLACTWHHLAITVPTTDPDLSMDLTARLAPLVGATSITFVGEAYATEAIDPDTPPAPGEVQARYQAGDPNVTAAIQVVTCYRGGTTRGTTLPYTYNPTTRTLAWAEPLRHQLPPLGFVSETMRIALLEPPTPLPDPTAEHVTLAALAQGLHLIGCQAIIEPTPT